MVAYHYPGPTGFDTYWGDPFDRGTLARTRMPLPGIMKDIREGRRLLLSFEKTMTGHEPRIAAILRSDAAKRVDFSIEKNSVNPTLMESVAQAIERGSVQIALGESGDNFRASYTTWKGHRPTPETEGRTGQLVVKLQYLPTHQGKVDVFHESVHALKDMRNYQINGDQDEALAYVADSIYWLAFNESLPKHQQTRFPPTGDSKPIYDASAALIESKDMLAKPGVMLRWSDCAALLKAIRQHSGYKSTHGH